MQQAELIVVFVHNTRSRDRDIYVGLNSILFKIIISIIQKTLHRNTTSRADSGISTQYTEAETEASMLV